MSQCDNVGMAMHSGEKIKDTLEMARFFDRCAEEGLFLEFDEWELERAKNLVNMFDIKRGWRIIEPGCGCGRMTRLLADAVGPGGRIDACELSAKMIEHCLKAGFPEWVHFYHSSVLDLRLPEGSADAVICFNVWPHFRKPELFLACFRKLLKPDGTLFIAHSCGREQINAIHKNSSRGVVTDHLLPPVIELGSFLKDCGWEPFTMIDESNLYFLKAFKERNR